MSPRTTTRGEYPHICLAVPSGRLGNYVGRDIVDGMEAMEQLFRYPIEDASGSCQGLARGSAEVGGGGVNSSGGGRGCYQRTRGGRYIGGGVDGYQEVDDKMVEGDDRGEGGFRGAADCRRSHVVGGGTDTQWENVILCYRPRGSGVEGSGGDSKLPAHSLHHLPILPPYFTGRSWIRHNQPQSQTAPAVSGHEGGCPVRDIYGPAHGV